VLNPQQFSCVVVRPQEILVSHKWREGKRGGGGGDDGREERGRERPKDTKEEKHTHKNTTLGLKSITKVSKRTVKYCFLVPSSQADLNCDVKPGNSVRARSSAMATPVVFVFTSCTS